jgi:hypothetical protein
LSIRAEIEQASVAPDDAGLITGSAVTADAGRLIFKSWWKMVSIPPATRYRICATIKRRNHWHMVAAPKKSSERELKVVNFEYRFRRISPGVRTIVTGSDGNQSAPSCAQTCI